MEKVELGKAAVIKDGKLIEGVVYFDGGSASFHGGGMKLPVPFRILDAANRCSYFYHHSKIFMGCSVALKHATVRDLTKRINDAA